MRNFALSLGLCGLVAGCSQPVPGHAPISFGVGAVDTVAPTVIEANHAIAVPAGAKGTLTLDLSSFVQQFARHVLYTVADIDHIEITISSANTAVATASIPKTSLVSGHATYTFNSLPSGTLMVNITAKDASGTVIGQDTHQVSLVAGQTANYAPALLLYPSSASSSGGGSGSTTGLNVALDVGDGATLQPIQTLVTLPVATTRVYLDASKNLWMVAADATNAPGNPVTTGHVMKFAPTGGAALMSTPIGSNASNGTYSGPLAIEPSGNFWASFDGSTLVNFGADGTPIRDTLVHADDVAVQANGMVWASWRDSVQFINPALPRAYTAPAGPGPVTRTIPDGQGGAFLFLQDINATTGPHDMWKISHIDTNGTQTASYARSNPLGTTSTVGSSFPVTSGLTNYIDQDPQGNFWVLSADEHRLVQLAPNLTVIKEVPTYPSPMAMDVDSAGKIWVFAYPPTPQRILTRYSATGQVEASAYVTDNTIGPGTFRTYLIAGDGNNAVWMGGMTSTVKFTF